MILYSLACDAGHGFDSWFRDSAAFEDQCANGLLACPACLSTQIAKAIMAPAIVGGRGDGGQPANHAPPTVDVALVDDDKSRDMRALLRGLRDKLVAEGDDVGPRFATEARRMHDGETPVRQIYGQASPVEARNLLEEGIMILPMPVVPDELN